MRAQRRARDLRAGSGRRAMPAATERRRFGSPRSAPQPAGARPTGPSSSRLCTVSSSGLSRSLGGSTQRREGCDAHTAHRESVWKWPGAPL